jgi:Fe-S cluster assembly scaffold protein SufB
MKNIVEHKIDSVVIPQGERQALFLTTLESQEIVLKDSCELLVAAVFEKGWENERILRIRLSGEKTRFQGWFVVLGEETESYPFRIEVIHEGKESVSRHSVRALLSDSSSMSLESLSRIGPEADRADTYFSHHALLLSSNAFAQAVPSLEILNDEVSAAHAASLGTADEQTLFYLQSRGLSHGEALALVARGFLLQDLEQIFDSALKEQISVLTLNFLENTQRLQNYFE